MDPPTSRSGSSNTTPALPTPSTPLRLPPSTRSKTTLTGPSLPSALTNLPGYTVSTTYYNPYLTLPPRPARTTPHRPAPPHSLFHRRTTPLRDPQRTSIPHHTPLLPSAAHTTQQHLTPSHTAPQHTVLYNIPPHPMVPHRTPHHLGLIPLPTPPSPTFMTNSTANAFPLTPAPGPTPIPPPSMTLPYTLSPLRPRLPPGVSSPLSPSPALLANATHASPRTLDTSSTGTKPNASAPGPSRLHTLGPSHPNTSPSMASALPAQDTVWRNSAMTPLTSFLPQPPWQHLPPP